MRGQSVTEQPNWRNGTQSNWPMYWRDEDRGWEYMLVVQRDWRAFVHQRSIADPGAGWTSYDISTNTEIGLIDDDDSHKSVCIGVDAEGYIHIAGNTRVQPHRYIMSDSPDDISSWSTGVMADSWYDGINNGRPGYSVYNTFERMSDGTLIMGLQAREEAGISYGADYMLWKRLPNSGEWVDCVPGSGGIVVECRTGYSHLAYIQGIFVDENDRLHMMYAFARYPGGGGDSVRKPVCYVYSDDVGATWKTITGNNVPAPINEDSETMEDGPAILLNGTDELQIWDFGRLTTFPETGYPINFIRDNAASIPPRKVVFYEDGEWKYLNADSMVVNEVHKLATEMPVFTWAWGDMWLWGVRSWPFSNPTRSYIGANLTKGGTYSIRAGAGGNRDFDKPDASFRSKGVYVPALTHAGGLHNGRRVTRIPLPDGDSPRVFEFGMGVKRKVAA